MKHVSGKRLAKVAEENGWLFISQSGSHAKYRTPITGETAIIPIHGNHDLRAGLQRQLMRDLNVTDDDL